ncbi:Unknown protein [Striga hermonthica]|uniref:F-box associated beta-propeller type 1 domain-containing protein n=1 Tax=Striga hermonthica TaxID=68872 RepID=A0A9N7NY89_STRHE|nr:Unknown protein [Striga hermonthica]
MRNYFSLLSWDDKSLSARQLHLPFPTIKDVSYCDGVVCLDDGFIDDRVALWNPSTNEFKFLPKTSIQLHPDADYLMFECPVIGFDSNSQHLKVLRLHLAERDGSLATITYPNYGEEKTFELWVRSHDGSWEWISTFCVPGAEAPLGFWTKDDLLFRGKGDGEDSMSCFTIGL